MLGLDSLVGSNRGCSLDLDGELVVVGIDCRLFGTVLHPLLLPTAIVVLEWASISQYQPDLGHLSIL